MGAAAKAASVPVPPVEKPAPDPAPFTTFWKAYDKKRGDKGKAEKKWNALKLDERLTILNGLPAYVALTPDPQYRPDPASFLNQKRWDADEWNKPLMAAARPLPTVGQPGGPLPPPPDEDPWADPFAAMLEAQDAARRAAAQQPTGQTTTVYR